MYFVLGRNLSTVPISDWYDNPAGFKAAKALLNRAAFVARLPANLFDRWEDVYADAKLTWRIVCVIAKNHEHFALNVIDGEFPDLSHKPDAHKSPRHKIVKSST